MYVHMYEHLKEATVHVGADPINDLAQACIGL